MKAFEQAFIGKIKATDAMLPGKDQSVLRKTKCKGGDP